MKPNNKDRMLASDGVKAEGTFGISHNDTAHIMTILRDTLYSDKVLAVEREYIANAWDANRAQGRGQDPIRVTLPTEAEPTLIIEDDGPGISPDDIFAVFTQYGASTKRNDDTSVGMLGIGSKSGFAYSDSFTVTSSFGGMRRSYVAVLDETNEGKMNLLAEEPCETTGVQIKLAVKSEDIEEFRQKAIKLLVHVEPRPIVNIELPDLPEKRVNLQHGYLFTNSDVQSYEDHGWTAVMGCVPYRINTKQLQHIGDHVNKVSGVIRFAIGEVDINASREELKYSTRTKAAIKEKMDALVDEYVLHLMKQIQSEDLNPWEKKLKMRDFTHLHLPLPEIFKGLNDASVSLKEPPPGLLFQHRKVTHGKRNRMKVTLEKQEHLLVDETSRIVIRDDIKRRMAGYTNIGDYDVIVTADTHNLTESFEETLSNFLDAMGCTGIPIVELSTLDWTPAAHGDVNVKHRKRVFEYDGYGRNSAKGSKCWSVVDGHVPLPTDVFVILHNFEPPPRFGAEYSADKKLLEEYGDKTNGKMERLPPVYGYKHTARKPIQEGDVIGVEYRIWRQAFEKRFLTPEIEQFIEAQKQKKMLNDFRFRQNNIQKVIKKLGTKSPLAVFLQKNLDARKFIASLTKKQVERFEVYTDAFPHLVAKDSDDDEIPEMLKPYPLLAHHGIENLWGDDEAKHWIDYVKLIDNRAKYNQTRVAKKASVSTIKVEEKTSDDDQDPVHDDERDADLRAGGEQLHGASDGAELQAAALCAAE